MAFVERELLNVIQPAFTQYYPAFGAWFQLKLLPGFLSGKREIIVAERKGFVGISALRLPVPGKAAKISSFYVEPLNRGRGIGHDLMNATCKILDGTHQVVTLVTVPEEALTGVDGTRFASILSGYEFQKVGDVPNKYRVGKIESVFRRSIVA